MPISESEKIKINDEGQNTALKIVEMVNLGKPFLERSALVDESQTIGKKEVELARKFLELVAPPDEKNKRTHDHLLLSANFARKIGERLSQNTDVDINIYELEILGLFHDLGRFLTHRYYRNDLLGHVILEKLGIKESLLTKMPSLRGYVGPKVYTVAGDLGIYQKIVDIADFCGKRKEDGGIRSFEEVMDYHQKSRSRYQDLTGLQSLWPTEKYAFEKMLPEGQDEGIILRSGRIYKEIRDWLVDQGVDVEQIRQEILKEVRNEKKEV